MKKNSEGLAAYRRRVVDEKKSAIMDGALKTFLSAGYERASLEAIARAAGVSTATLYKHFRTKQAVFGAIMERMWGNDLDDLEAPSAPSTDDAPEIALGAIGRAYAELLSAPDVVALFRVIISEAPRFPDLGQELYERGKKPYLDRLESYLRAQCERGRLHVDDVPLAARQFLGMINDVVFWPRQLIVDLTIGDDMIEKTVDEAVLTFMARYGAR